MFNWKLCSFIIIAAPSATLSGTGDLAAASSNPDDDVRDWEVVGNAESAATTLGGELSSFSETGYD
jgi:hypothetical protein